MSNDTRRNETFWVPLAQVRIGERRRGISAATVERYREWLEQGRGAPPVHLVRDGEWFLVRDGRHRVAAAVEAGFAFIEAELGRIARVMRVAAIRAAARGALRIDRLTWGRSTSSASAPAAGSW